jgi:predicted dehydrogenase
MKILIIGLGSIGRRHALILHNNPNIQCAALRTGKGSLKQEIEGIVEFYSINEALAFKPDGVIISTPTAYHVQSALPFLNAGIKVLIEKPISYASEEVKALEPFSHLIRIAYCLRFLPIYLNLEIALKNDPPFKLGFKRSFYLPKWHPYADYREEYVARKDLGGGVIRTLSHEIDLAVKWFGKPKPDTIIGVCDKVSFLEMNTDDYAFFSMKSLSGCRINFELDLFSPTNTFQGEAYTAKGKYYWDLNSLHFYGYSDESPKIIYNFKNSDSEEMYAAQLKDFELFISEGISNNSTLDESRSTLEIIEKLSNVN